jgi:acyl carrier protein
MKSPKEEISAFLLSSIGISKLDDNEDIFETGLVNSLFAIEMMVFLETTFSIKVVMDDLDMNNFKSVAQLSEFVKNKKNAVNA